MSVRVDQRTESPLLFYKIARELRQEITIDMLERLQGKEHPDYIVDYLRKDILTIMQKLMQSISMANAIYPVCELEIDRKRVLQDNAIGLAESLQNELEYCVDIMPDTLSCLLHYSDKIDHLIKVLRRWKKSNSKILKRIRTQSETANFCNCNNNGNANNNNANNSNGVAMDFTST